MWQKWGTGNTVGGGARPGCSFNLRPGSGAQGYSPEDSVPPHPQGLCCLGRLWNRGWSCWVSKKQEAEETEDSGVYVCEGEREFTIYFLIKNKVLSFKLTHFLLPSWFSVYQKLIILWTFTLFSFFFR